MTSVVGRGPCELFHHAFVYVGLVIVHTIHELGWRPNFKNRAKGSLFLSLLARVQDARAPSTNRSHYPNG